MALLRRGITAENLSDEAEVPNPLDVDPNYRAAVELLNAFSARHDRLSQERLRLTFELHFASRSAENDNSTDQQLRVKLKSLRDLPPLRPVPSEPPASPSPAIKNGLTILAGETVTAEPSIAGQIAEIDRQLTALSTAHAEQTEVVQHLHGEVCQRIAETLLPRWNASLRYPGNRAMRANCANARELDDVRITHAAAATAQIGSSAAAVVRGDAARCHGVLQLIVQKHAGNNLSLKPIADVGLG